MACLPEALRDVLRYRLRFRRLDEALDSRSVGCLLLLLLQLLLLLLLLFLLLLLLLFLLLLLLLLLFLRVLFWVRTRPLEAYRPRALNPASP